jgi:diguanylate cyclase (GGDEF)-like protein/PAS domain S-box-containing protein
MMDGAMGRDTNIDYKFWLLFEQAAVGMALISPKGHYLRANPELCRMLGYSEEELLAFTFNDITHPEDLPTGNDLWNKLLGGEIAAYRTETRYIRRDGRMVWGLVSMSVVRDEAGVPMQSIAIVQDITARKTAQMELEQARNRYQAISDSVNDLISIHKLTGDFLFANAASAKVLGYTPTELMGTSLFRYIHPDDLEVVHEAFSALGEGPSVPLRVLYRAFHKDGSFVLLETRAQPFGGPGDQQREIICVSSDSGGRYAEQAPTADQRRPEEKSREESRDPALTDPLTGLRNKRDIDEIVRSRLASPRAASFPFGMILVEIDDFATSNDIYGQAVGNEILKRVARVVQDTCRIEDAIARAGDEYLIMLPSTNPGGTIVVGEKLIRNIKAIDWSDTPLQGEITVSIGATCVTYGTGLTLPELIAILNEQLTQAKEGGPNRLVMNTRQTAQRLGQY